MFLHKHKSERWLVPCQQCFALLHQAAVRPALSTKRLLQVRRHVGTSPLYMNSNWSSADTIMSPNDDREGLKGGCFVSHASKTKRKEGSVRREEGSEDQCGCWQYVRGKELFSQDEVKI